MRPTRLAEAIAGDLRDQILSGDLADGDRLLPVDGLVEHYRVSAPSIREALRVLETEGLISVRLGKFGGATIHRPRPERAAYMLGLVLEAQRVRASDLADALLEATLACVRTCVRREDRATAVIPVLRASLERASDPEHPENFVTGLIEFNEAVISECGNDTLVLVVGALRALWVGQNLPWPERHLLESDEKKRAEIIAGHWRALSAIEAGDAEGASRRLYEIRMGLDPERSPTRRRNPVVKAVHTSNRLLPGSA